VKKKCRKGECPGENWPEPSQEKGILMHGGAEKTMKAAAEDVTRHRDGVKIEIKQKRRRREKRESTIKKRHGKKSCRIWGKERTSHERVECLPHASSLTKSRRDA